MIDFFTNHSVIAMILCAWLLFGFGSMAVADGGDDSDDVDNRDLDNPGNPASVCYQGDY